MSIFYRKNEPFKILGKIIIFILIPAFLCSNTAWPVQKSVQLNSLQVNSAFDKDPRNNGAQAEMADEYSSRGGVDLANPPADNIEPPAVPCPVPGGESQIIQALLMIDEGMPLIVELLESEQGRLWLGYCLRKLFTMDPPLKFDPLFSSVVRLAPGHLFMKFFYEALENIDPAKAGLIILRLLKTCDDPGFKRKHGEGLTYQIRLLEQLLAKIASLWQLDPEDVPYLTVFFKGKLKDRSFLEQLNLYPGENENICYLGNEEMASIIEVSGDTPQNLLQIAAGGLLAGHLQFDFPDDLIPYIEYLLGLEGFFMPFREMIEREVRRRKSIDWGIEPDMDISALGSLYGFIISRQEEERNLRDFLMDCAEAYHDKGERGVDLLPEGIIVNHHGIQILLMPDLTRKRGWETRRSPYRVVGFVHGDGLFMLAETNAKNIETYLSSLSPPEIKHYMYEFYDKAILTDADPFLELATSNRGEIYAAHDSALGDEVAEVINSVAGPVSVVDLGMGGGELLLCLMERFAGNERVKYFGTDPDPKSLRLARARLPGHVKTASVVAEELSQAGFAADLQGTHKIAFLEGVVAMGVTESVKGQEILEELLKIGFDSIFITGNTPVNLHYEKIATVLQQYGYQLERTLYPQNLFNHNKPKIMFVIKKIRQVPEIDADRDGAEGNEPDPVQAKRETKEQGPADSADEQYIPLELEDGGNVERPAVYRLDREFWDKVEESNPGTLARVKKIVALYFDNAQEREALGLDPEVSLKEGVDYDFISGRSVIIRLNTPVEIGSVIMKEIIIKGAPFKKSKEDEEFYTVDDLTEDELRQFKEEAFSFEFDPDGNGRLDSVRWEREDTNFYYKSKNEHDVGRKGFKDKKCPVRILPVMDVHYLEDKAKDGGELGVVVIASPTRTKHLLDWTKNRLGHLLTILSVKLKNARGQPNSEEVQARIFTDITETASVYGLILRGFHDAGYTHGNPHSGNIIVDLDTDEVHVGDLTDARLKSEMTEKQAFGYQLRDIWVVGSDFLRSVNSPDVTLSDIRFAAHAFKCFLINYFGEQGLQFHFDDDLRILRYAHDLSELIVTAFADDNPGSKQVYSDHILRNSLAYLVARAAGFEVEDQGALRQAGMAAGGGSDFESLIRALCGMETAGNVVVMGGSLEDLFTFGQEPRPVSVEDLIFSLHLTVFSGQEPKRDVVDLLAEEADRHGYGREIIFQALLAFAEQSAGEPPSWVSIKWLASKMAEIQDRRNEAREVATAV